MDCCLEAEEFYKKSLEFYRCLSTINPSVYEPDVANLLNNLAALYYRLQRYSEAEEYFKKSLDIRRCLCADNSLVYESDVAQSLNNLVALYSKSQRYLDAEKVAKELLDVYLRMFKEYSSISGRIASLYSNLSFFAIFTSKFSDSANYAKEALTLNPDNLGPYTNLAASLLLQGRFEEAKELYLKYKDELKDSFLSDFEEFTANNIIPQERLDDVEKIIELLNRD
jgi:tetratricopeptide (TPR) repeat protein